MPAVLGAFYWRFRLRQERTSNSRTVSIMTMKMIWTSGEFRSVMFISPVSQPVTDLRYTSVSVPAGKLAPCV